MPTVYIPNVYRMVWTRAAHNSAGSDNTMEYLVDGTDTEMGYVDFVHTYIYMGLL